MSIQIVITRFLSSTKTLVLFIALLAIPVSHAQDVLTPELLWEIPRVSAPQVSPDGERMVYSVTRYDLRANKGESDLYTLSVDGGEPVRLTSLPGSESNPRWRPDGRKIGFLSSQSGSNQLWEVSPDGSDPRQVTNMEGGIGNFLYAPSGDRISFTRDVKLDSTVNEIYADLDKANARIIDELMYRHWDSWHDFTYRHVFTAPYADGEVGEPTDLMEGQRFDTPLSPFGGVEQINWSPDGNVLAYTSKRKTGVEYATSTNSDIFLVDLESGEETNLTEGMMGYDLEPVFSPDGRYLAWLSMEREGYESDRNRLFLFDRKEGTKRELTEGFDQNTHAPTWSENNETIYFTSEREGTIQLYAVDVAGSEIRQITEGANDYGAFDVAGRYLIASRMSMSAPTELYRVDTGSGEAVRLTQATEPVMSQINVGTVKKRMVKATDGADILTWVIYPPDFDSTKQYPALLYAQGGPQSQVSQFFSYRWNFQLMAANGYIVIAPNRRGLPGFGQAWNEAISGDWGGQAMRDLLSAIDDVAKEPYVDTERLGAIGASFGGYTVYWLAGNHDGRFKTFVSHAGLFNLESMYGATEELFFVNFDLGGPYWKSPESYERFSPHLFVENWDTPMLVIHGEKDFRVPINQGMEAFTALQAKGIESRFLYFPEEGHWVLKPQNGVLWHRVFFDWLDRYLR